MTELQLDKRYASAGELQKDLLTILQGKPLSSTFETPASARRRWLAPALIGAVLVALMFTYFNLRIEEKWKNRFEDTRKTEAPVKTAPVEAPPSPVVAQGEIRFDGKPITDITDLEPEFWFRNEKEGTVQTAQVSYDKGKFQIRGLPAGQFGVSVQYDLNSQNPMSYPGDLRAWEQFQVAEGTPSEVEVEVLKIIHLIQPQDNGTTMDKWGPDQVDRMIAFSDPVTFEWESLGKDVHYDYKINRVQWPYTSVDTEAGGTVQKTRLSLKLPRNQANEYYILQLYARRAGRQIGMLMTHGHNGY